MKYPVIATRGVVVFPNHSAILEVGRKISLNAIDLSIVQSETKLVIVSQRDINKNGINSANDMYVVGTLVSINIEKSTDNYKTISVFGLERVKLNRIEFNGGNLIEADVKILKSIQASEKKEQAFINTISTKLDEFVGDMIKIPKNVLSSLASGISATDLADVVGHYLPLPLAKKQRLLEILDVNERLALVNKFLIEETQVISIDKDIDSQVKGVLDIQQREFLLREKLKAIKEELGDINSKDSDVDAWKKSLESERFPEYVKKIAFEEIKRYESMPPISAEAHVSKGYIDWIIKLPWNKFSKDSEDLKKAKKILDKHHYGLIKIKERIIEYLAVKINTKSAISPILTLVGPPGVGKTSLGQSIAQAINREFIKVSLGGVKDEAEIRGHRRTYVGALPGKIIQALNKAKTSNPVILLDEIDKMASDYRGDPTSAMLEVLDPEQNKNFQDHYLEIEYDLSKIMFIATANFYDQIPGPLRDRVETIWLSQYTSEEKNSIAKNHIIPKVLKNHGLTKNQFKIADKTIENIIKKYTQEAGVRDLQRVFSKLARKVVLLKVEKKIKSSFNITLVKVKEFLGKEKVYNEILKGKGEIGLVNGMYYSSVGGGILPIEVTTYDGKNGGIKLTGQIQDVMKESLNIAIGYLRSNAKKFGIKFNFDSSVIQVHVPEGAMPKDGPSAGTAFTTAVLSALIKKAIPKDIALTGEITLRGNILPIGGLKEKTLGAVELGVKTIFIPQANKKDLDDLAKKVKNEAKIILVENYNDIYKQIFL